MREDEELSTVEKIEWLIEYEGCELADGYAGLMSFLQYASSDENSTRILDLIASDVDRVYELTQKEYDERDDYNTGRIDDIIESLLSDLAVTPEEEVKIKWRKRLKDLL